MTDQIDYAARRISPRKEDLIVGEVIIAKISGMYFVCRIEQVGEDVLDLCHAKGNYAGQLAFDYLGIGKGQFHPGTLPENALYVCPDDIRRMVRFPEKEWERYPNYLLQAQVAWIESESRP